METGRLFHCLPLDFTCRLSRETHDNRSPQRLFDLKPAIAGIIKDFLFQEFLSLFTFSSSSSFFFLSNAPLCFYSFQETAEVRSWVSIKSTSSSFTPSAIFIIHWVTLHQTLLFKKLERTNPHVLLVCDRSSESHDMVMCIIESGFF